MWSQSTRQGLFIANTVRKLDNAMSCQARCPGYGKHNTHKASHQTHPMVYARHSNCSRTRQGFVRVGIIPVPIPSKEACHQATYSTVPSQPPCRACCARLACQRPCAPPSTAPQGPGRAALASPVQTGGFGVEVGVRRACCCSCSSASRIEGNVRTGTDPPIRQTANNPPGFSSLVYRVATIASYEKTFIARYTAAD